MRAKLVTLWTVTLLLLAACAGDKQQATSTAGLSVDYEGALSVEAQLMIGTLKLEETGLAVTQEQAAQLLPLWKAFRSLGSSDTASEQEFEALTRQIQKAMTSEQLQAIAALQLTQESMTTVVQELGLAPQDLGQRGEADRPGGTGPAGNAFPGGGFPGGGAPGGGFQGGGVPGGGPGFVPGGGGQAGGGFDQNLDPEALATAQALRGGRDNSRFRTTLFLINPLLELLETRAGS